MSDALPMTHLARHVETAWTISRQHTGRTDLPTTARGEAEAHRLGERLDGLKFAAVLTSPFQRAGRTCQLAGFGSAAIVEPDLMECNYGAYEGRTSVEIHAERPDWDVSRDDCPEGESPDEIGARADRVVLRVRGVAGDTLLFFELALSSSICRALARARTRRGPAVRARNSQLERAGEPRIDSILAQEHREKAGR